MRLGSSPWRAAAGSAIKSIKHETAIRAHVVSKIRRLGVAEPARDLEREFVSRCEWNSAAVIAYE